MLTITDLHAAYGPIEALKGVSLSVGEGETVALLGANGAGKTTLLRTLSALHPTAGGTVALGGDDIAALSAEARVKRGLIHVPERRRIFAGLSVQENLEVAATPWRKMGQSIQAELETVFQAFPRLEERKTQRGWSLSGGEQQMLAIGRALMAKPKVLLLDEPSLGLAPKISEEVYQHIARINADGVTVLVVEQNAMLALSVAARGYVLEQGQITLEGQADQLKSDPRVRDAYLGGH